MEGLDREEQSIKEARKELLLSPFMCVCESYRVFQHLTRVLVEDIAGHGREVEVSSAVSGESRVVRRLPALGRHRVARQTHPLLAQEVY